MRRPKPPGHTTRAGLGYDHQQARKDALTLLRSGRDRCPRCWRPMYAWQALQLGDWPSRVIAAKYRIIPRKRLEHATCNMRAGANLGNRMRAAGIAGWPKTGVPAPRKQAARTSGAARARRNTRW